MTEFQHFWRCAHHPIATQNFFEGLVRCEWECDAQELQWHHGGEHPTPFCVQKLFVPYHLEP